MGLRFQIFTNFLGVESNVVSGLLVSTNCLTSIKLGCDKLPVSDELKRLDGDVRSVFIRNLGVFLRLYLIADSPGTLREADGVKVLSESSDFDVGAVTLFLFKLRIRLDPDLKPREDPFLVELPRRPLCFLFIEEFQ